MAARQSTTRGLIRCSGTLRSRSASQCGRADRAFDKQRSGVHSRLHPAVDRGTTQMGSRYRAVCDQLLDTCGGASRGRGWRGVSWLLSTAAKRAARPAMAGRQQLLELEGAVTAILRDDARIRCTYDGGAEWESGGRTFVGERRGSTYPSTRLGSGALVTLIALVMVARRHQLGSS